MNNDLISRSALYEKVHQCKVAINACTNHDYLIGYASALSGVEGQIAAETAIDAEPVRHGEWKEASGCRIICNNCGHYPLYDYFGRLKLSPYCWFCGVKMRGDKVGEGN